MKSPPKENVVAFLKFIQERYNIYLRRQAGKPWPWTKDPILQHYKFCNVYREHDKTTIWIRKNWCEPYANHKWLWFAMCMARQINWPDSLSEIGFPTIWDPKQLVACLRRRKAAGLKVYSSAYMITGMLPGKDKPAQTAYAVLNPLRRNTPPVWKAKTLEEAFNLLNGRPGFGPFLAYEVVTDLRHTRYLKNATDIMTWANAGPGAIRGLHRIWNRPIWRDRANRKGTQKSAPARLPKGQALDEMRYLLDESVKGLNLKLEMREIEHCLCEWDKYERARLGQGVLEKYRPPTSSLV